MAFYEQFLTHKRHESWTLLKQLYEQIDLPWICAGDFNEILSLAEKVGGAIRPAKQMDDFHDVLRECDLTKLSFNGPFFTWSCRRGNEFIKERLDQGLVNEVFREKFPYSHEKHVVVNASDHLPLVFNISPKRTGEHYWKKLFRFENMWARYKDSEDIIRKSWLGSPRLNLHDLVERIVGCSS